MSSPPSTKFQLWPQMTLTCLTLWVLSCLILIPICWEIRNSTLGSLYLHLEYLKNSSRVEYWSLIESKEKQIELYLRVLLPAVTLLFFSLIITKKLLWVSGGREMARHLSGPKLLVEKDAIRHAKAMHRSEVR